MFPQTKLVVQLDENNFFLTTEIAHISPLEADQGIYMIPGGCYDIPLPEERKGFIPQFNHTLQKWKYVENHKDEIVYDTTTQQESKVDYFGPIKEGYTSIKPADYNQKWNGVEWIFEESYISNRFKEEQKTILTAIVTKADALKDGFLDGYPKVEIESFYRQESEALEFKNGINTNPLLLTQLATERGIKLEVLVEKVLEKSAFFAYIIGIIIGQKQRFEDRINIATEQHQLDKLKEEIEQWELEPLEVLMANFMKSLGA